MSSTMTSTASRAGEHASRDPRAAPAAAVHPLFTLAGRLMFAAMFLFAGPNHFKQSSIEYAGGMGVPFPELLVPVSGVIAFLGALSIMLGFRARLGAWLIVAFLVPVTLMMHAFWNVTDPSMQQMQWANFMKNVSMLGGALLITQVGAGPLSVDAARRGARDLRESSPDAA